MIERELNIERSTDDELVRQALQRQKVSTERSVNPGAFLWHCSVYLPRNVDTPPGLENAAANAHSSQPDCGTRDTCYPDYVWQ